MTAQSVFNMAMALLADDGSGYIDYAVPIINMILAETFNINNSLRIYNGKDKLTDIQTITNLDDTLTYEDELIIKAFPYGIASNIILNDNDMNKTAYLNNKYYAAVNECRKAIKSAIIDVYEVTD